MIERVKLALFRRKKFIKEILEINVPRSKNFGILFLTPKNIFTGICLLIIGRHHILLSPHKIPPQEFFFLFETMFTYNKMPNSINIKIITFIIIKDLLVLIECHSTNLPQNPVILAGKRRNNILLITYLSSSLLKVRIGL